MQTLRVLLGLSTVTIYALTVLAASKEGANWPAVALGDIAALGWRGQFDFDFIVHLLLLATWIVWREGASAKSYVYGFLSIVMGGMFGFPYILYATYAAGGRVSGVLLGVHERS